MRAVLFKSNERFEAFKKQFEENGIEVVVLDFKDDEWLSFDFNAVDIVVYYPSFQFSSNSPISLWHVKDNIQFISENYPHLKIYPDPGLLKYYNDKYTQYLFLKKNKLPIPETIALNSEEKIEEVCDILGFPLVVKNRYGAGGGNVFKVEKKEELIKYYRISTSNFTDRKAITYFLKMLSKRLFWYHTIKEKNMPYPFLSPPLITQKFVSHDKDLKLVLYKQKVIEGHWRGKASTDMWKVNIDGGGVGEWSFIPENAIKIGMDLAKKLDSTWLNIDLFVTDNGFLISEFSPVWHHYKYKEKRSFVYKDNYNLSLKLEDSLNLEKIIIDSMVDDKTK